MNDKLSVLIPTLNEEGNISACIDSVREIADEILVMDNFSTDRTTEISRAAGAIVHQRKFDHFAANKNAGIELLQNDWVLILDADERLTPVLRKEIRDAIRKPQAEAYAIL
ncbi:glycosyltransferase family 2 protein, partial [bacterium]|nr:glycosyltransferase family 2 protein [bacterium]